MKSTIGEFSRNPRCFKHPSIYQFGNLMPRIIRCKYCLYLVKYRPKSPNKTSRKTKGGGGVTAIATQLSVYMVQCKTVTLEELE